MRVVMLIWSYWPGHEGGAERQCRKIVEQFAGKDIEFIVLTSWFRIDALLNEEMTGGKIVRMGVLAPFETKLKELLIRLINTLYSNRFSGSHAERRTHVLLFWIMLPVVWFSRLLFICSLSRWFAKNATTVDVVHVHEADWLAGVAAWIGTRYHLPVIAKTATTPALPKIGYDVPWRALWHRSRMNCCFIAQHEELVNELVAQGVVRERIFLLANGVIIPDKIAHPGCPGPVLYVGNFSQGAHQKAFDVLIQAWSLVHQRVPSARLDLLGGGDVSQWRRLAVELGCEKSVRFLGKVSDPSIYYERSCLFVLPSRLEGISNALLEAQSYGLPCVVSDIPGNVKVVQDGVNGLVVPVGDVNALAQAIIRLLDGPELRVQLGSQAREKVSAEFSLSSVKERLLYLYGLVAQKRRTLWK